MVNVKSMALCTNDFKYNNDAERQECMEVATFCRNTVPEGSSKDVITDCMAAALGCKNIGNLTPGCVSRIIRKKGGARTRRNRRRRATKNLKARRRTSRRVR